MRHFFGSLLFIASFVISGFAQDQDTARPWARLDEYQNRAGVVLFEPPMAPATRLEEFQARTGTVIIRDFSRVGALYGPGGSVAVAAREFRDANNPGSQATGISVSVRKTVAPESLRETVRPELIRDAPRPEAARDATRSEREGVSFIDAGEIDGLLQAIDYIFKAGKDATRLDDFAVEYHTKGDFRLLVFTESKGQFAVAVSSGRMDRATAYLKFAELADLRQLIVTARSRF